MAKPNNPKPAKGQKSKPWFDDPEILRRLATVEDLVLAGYRNTEIANHLQLSEATIRRDRERIAELWRKHASGDIITLRERSIANLRRIQRLADNEFRKAEDKTLNLRIQLDAEKEIARLQGTVTPVEVPVSFKDSKLDFADLSTADLIKRAAALEALAKQLLDEESGNEGDSIDLSV